MDHVVPVNPQLGSLFERPKNSVTVHAPDPIPFDHRLQRFPLSGVARQRIPKGLCHEHVVWAHDCPEDVSERLVEIIPGPSNFANQPRVAFDSRAPLLFGC
jgi:hypothetical protein